MKFAITVFTFFWGFHAIGQNLIPNSTFEDINYCETEIPCSPSAWYSVSKFPYGYQNDLPAFEGKHSIAFLVAYEKEVRSYWQTMILCSMQTGQDYIISFNLYPRNIKFDPKYFGIYFSDTLFRSRNDTIIQKNNATVGDNESTNLLKQGWYKITMTYKADGSEKYLLLGNFSKNSNEEILKEAGNKTRFIEYYIDNVVLKSTDKKMNKCPGYNTRLDSLYAANFRHHDFPDYKPTEPVSNSFVPPLQSKTDTLILSKINFNFGSDKLVNVNMLNKYFDTINISKIDKIEIVGYTDSIGSIAYNLDLSERRALSVKNYLVSNYKLPESLIETKGKGIIKDEINLENNRRVEIWIYKH